MIQDGADERVILFVQLPEGNRLDEALIKRIKDEVRLRRSPRHVPARVSLTLIVLNTDVHAPLRSYHLDATRFFRCSIFRTR